MDSVWKRVHFSLMMFLVLFMVSVLVPVALEGEVAYFILRGGVGVE